MPHLLKNGGGPIVLTSSDSSSIGEVNRPTYGVVKAGTNALVRHIATRWGREGKRVNALMPFAITAEMRQRLDPAQLEAWLGAGRSDHLGSPEESAAVAFLLSDDASLVNGQLWGVNGGCPSSAPDPISRWPTRTRRRRCC